MTGRKHNYASVMIRSLGDFKEIENAFDSEWFFRGQRCSSWDLQTALERKDSGVERAHHVAFEKHTLSKARPFLGRDSRDGDDFSRLAFLQHHGCKTRLLDFTRSLKVALYFATEAVSSENDGSGDGAIWAVSKRALGKKIEQLCGSSSNDFWSASCDLIQTSIQGGMEARIDKELAVVFCQPAMPNPRLVAQQGLFLAPLNLSRDFKANLTIGLNLTGTKEPVRRIGSTQELAQAVREGQEDVFKLITAAAAAPEFRGHLETDGLNKAALYPDVEKFASDLNQWRPEMEHKL